MVVGRQAPGRRWLWIAGGLGLVGLVMLVAFWGQALWRDRVATERASAQIVRVEGVWNQARMPTTDYCPVLRWTIDGKSVEHQSPGCRDAASDFKVGEMVTVRYAPRDPSQVFIATWWSIYNMAVLVTPFGAFFLLLSWFMVHAYRYRLRVARGEIDPVAEARARARARARR